MLTERLANEVGEIKTNNFELVKKLEIELEKILQANDKIQKLTSEILTVSESSKVLQNELHP